jgi:hypothetical protein
MFSSITESFRKTKKKPYTTFTLLKEKDCQPENLHLGKKLTKLDTK